MKERETITKFNNAIPVTSRELRNGGLDFYFDVVDPMILKEQATEYPDMWGDVWYKRNNPIPPDLTPEQIHLQRNCEHTLGVSKII